jgi:hypothetical protein
MLQTGQKRSVAVQVITEPENHPDTGLKLRTAAGIRVQDLVQIFMASRARERL